MTPPTGTLPLMEIARFDTRDFVQRLVTKQDLKQRAVYQQQ